jgi:molybdopterin-biosynthesis enzyme MoeA-like protein
VGQFFTVIGSNGAGGGTQRPAGDLKQHNSQWQGGVDGEESVRVFDRRASCARPPQVIMPTANSPASKEVVTAALLVIGGKILSGRTKDQNIGYVAEYLTAVGIDLKEVRVVGDEERAIVDALNALRHRFTYIFTTGGIGPTHGDITADCVAKAFGVPIDTDPRALAILHEWVKTTGAEMNEARLRLTRIPKGADLILNKVSGAPGFWIGNVIVMAGVPSIMQAMLDEVAPKLKIGVRMLSETVRADAREGDIGMQLGEIAKANPGVAIGSYPFFDPQHGPNTNVVLRARDAQKLAQAKRAVEDMLERVRQAQSKSA